MTRELPLCGIRPLHMAKLVWVPLLGRSAWKARLSKPAWGTAFPG